MLSNTIVLLTFTFLAIIFALVIWICKRNASLIRQKELQIDKLKEQNTIARNEIEELRSGVLSIGSRLLEVEQMTQVLQEQQQQLNLVDPDSKLYSRAVKMVELGADLEEVMRECELPRAEAELLFSLHHNQS